MPTLTVTPHAAEAYEPGAILEYDWGYDQTNIDYFVVLKRADTPKGDTFLTLQAMATPEVSDGPQTMTGQVTPGAVDTAAKPFRRKLHRDGDRGEIGVAIRDYGWCSLWDGQPSRVSHYA